MRGIVDWVNEEHEYGEIISEIGMRLLFFRFEVSQPEIIDEEELYQKFVTWATPVILRSPYPLTYRRR